MALAKSGVDPIIVGLAAGLIAYAAPAARSDLERATSLVRDFREQPTPGRAQLARAGLATAISPNDRLAQIYHPWTSYVIVPLFGLANAGIPIDAKFLASAYRSPVTLGIIFGYVIGKPLGVTLASAVVTKASRGRLRPPVGWAAVIGGGATAGTGFTVSLLIASVAFTGSALEEATLGILTAAVVSAVVAWLVFAATARLPAPLRARALLGRSEVIVDLVDPVDPDLDHVRGSADAPVTLVEYGDFQCPHCGKAEPTIRELLADFADLRYVWRQLPLNDVHPQAQLAAEASEAAAAQGAFWSMHDLLLEHQGDLGYDHLISYAQRLGLDIDRFVTDLETHRWADRVAADVESADLSGVSGTPTFFINGQRQPAPYDIVTLSRAVQTAHPDPGETGQLALGPAVDTLSSDRLHRPRHVNVATGPLVNTHRRVAVRNRPPPTPLRDPNRRRTIPTCPSGRPRIVAFQVSHWHRHPTSKRCGAGRSGYQMRRFSNGRPSAHPVILCQSWSACRSQKSADAFHPRGAGIL